MKIFKGEVISTKMDKTATVMVDRIVSHPIYKKRYKRSKKYHVHDPYGVAVGQKVEFVSSKPYSKLKKWVITKVAEKKEEKAKSKTVKKNKKVKEASK